MDVAVVIEGIVAPVEAAVELDEERTDVGIGTNIVSADTNVGALQHLVHLAPVQTSSHLVKLYI